MHYHAGYLTLQQSEKIYVGLLVKAYQGNVSFSHCVAFIFECGADVLNWLWKAKLHIIVKCVFLDRSDSENVLTKSFAWFVMVMQLIQVQDRVTVVSQMINQIELPKSLVMSHQWEMVMVKATSLAEAASVSGKMI